MPEAWMRIFWTQIALARLLGMAEEVIKEIVTSTCALAATRSQDQLMSSPDNIDGHSVPPDIKRKQKPVPHYLRASTSSCHDNCKFGTHHSPEPKKRWPALRAQLRRASTGQETRVEIILPKRARPEKDQKLKISHVKDGQPTVPAKPESTNSKSPQEIVPDYSERIPCIEDLSGEGPGNQARVAECFVISRDVVADFGDGELSDGAESIELEMPLAIQESDDSEEQNEDAISPSQDVCKVEKGSPVNDVFDQTANEFVISEKMDSQNMKKHEQAEPETKSKRSAAKPTKPMVKGTSSVARNTALRQRSKRTSHPKADGTVVEISTEPKPMSATTDANVTTTTKVSRQKKISPTVTSAVPKLKEIKVPSPYNVTDLSGKPSRLAKPKISTAKNALSPSLSSEKQTVRKITVKADPKNAQVILQKQREEKVTTRPLKLSRSLNMPAKYISSVKVRAVKKGKIAPPIKSSKKVSGTENGAADAKEKVIKMASPKVQKPEVTNKQSKPGKEKTDTPTPRTRTTRGSKPATVTSTTTQSPRKLTFRRGKVLNPDDGSSSSTPRRLRFRPAMAAADVTGRSRGVRVTGKGAGRGATGARDAGTSRAEFVVLRRRQGGVTGGEKRQVQVLLNNVIEATASRLVAEARKSKVKALVGAFETVISLQEGIKAGPPAATGTVAR